MATDELRELAHGIHPSVVTDHGLADALRGMAAASVLPIRLRHLPARRADTTAEVTAYFVVAEAVTNARKHAGARSVDVWVAVANGMLRVEIADDGVGGASERGLRHPGPARPRRGDRRRVQRDQSPGGGTRIVAELPA